MRVSVLSLLALTPLLAGCESSMRLPALGSPFGSSERIAPQSSQPVAPQIEPAPTPGVQSAPLPPPVTRQDLAPPPGASAMPQTSQQTPPVTPNTPAATPGLTTPGGTEDATRTARAEPPRRAAPSEDDAPAPKPTQTSVTGNWSAREATGGSCKVTLSSSPKLDLYNASTSGCQSKDLQRVTAWELRGEDVYLYEPGGAVAARLKAQGRKMDGALAKTGAPITLSK